MIKATRKNISQTIILISFYLNIEAAMLAKLGGIPWRLDKDDDGELIIGVGAF
jgi:hypothetical protein